MRRNKIIQYLYKYYKQYDRYPNIREIGQHVGIPSTSTTNYYLDRLGIMGLLIREPHISRGVSLTVTGKLEAMRGLGMRVDNVCPHCGEPLIIRSASNNSANKKQPVSIAA